MPERKMTEKRATPQITALMTCHFRRSAAMRLCLERKEKNLLGHLCIVFTLIIKSLFTEKKVDVWVASLFWLYGKQRQAGMSAMKS